MNEVGKDCGEVRLIEQVTGCDATLLRYYFSKLSIISNYTKNYLVAQYAVMYGTD